MADENVSASQPQRILTIVGDASGTAVYTHWQPGTFIRVVCAVVLALLLLPLLFVGGDLDGVTLAVLLVGPGLLLLVLIVFHGLGTEVSADSVRVWFGPGWIRKILPTSEVSGVRQVRNGVWMGWGIRWIGHRTMLWNVSGLDAVELELRAGRRFRIGTNDPEGLAAALREATRR